MLRRSYRDGDKVKNETLGNLSHLRIEVIELVRRALRGETFVPATEVFEITQSRPHGHVQATTTAMQRLCFASLVSSKPSRYPRQGGFPSDKCLEGFDYRHQTTITKRQVNALLDFAFLDNRENLVLIGTPGVGKTHLAIGIGQKAVGAGYQVLFRNALDLFDELELAEMKGELKKTLHRLAKVDALVIDELGYLPMSRQARYALFQLINRFYEHRSLVITSNKDFTSWGNSSTTITWRYQSSTGSSTTRISTCSAGRSIG